MQGKAITTCVCVAAAGGFMLSGDDRSEVYDQPVAQVFAAMQRTGVPPGLRTGFLGEGSVAVETGPGYQIEWKFRRDHRYIGALVAKAEPKGNDQTRITVSFENGVANGKDRMVADGQAYAKSVGLPVMFEYMDARIEGRAPNADILENASMAYMSANPKAVGRETNQLFNEVSSSLDEHIRKERNEGPQNPYQATAPEIDLSKHERKNNGY